MKKCYNKKKRYDFGGTMDAVADAALPMLNSVVPGLGTIASLGKNLIQGAIQKKKQQKLELEIQSDRGNELMQADATTLSGYPTKGVNQYSFAFGGSMPYSTRENEIAMNNKYNAEGGRETELSSTETKFEGPKHSQGGIDIDPNQDGFAEAEVEGGEVASGQRVYSDRLSIPPQIINQMKLFGLNLKPTDTFASVSEKIGRKKGMFEADLNSMDSAKKNTAKRMIERYDSALDSIFQAQESLKPSRPQGEQEQQMMGYGGKLNYSNGGDLPFLKPKNSSLYVPGNASIYAPKLPTQLNKASKGYYPYSGLRAIKKNQELTEFANDFEEKSSYEMGRVMDDMVKKNEKQASIDRYQERSGFRHPSTYRPAAPRLYGSASDDLSWLKTPRAITSVSPFASPSKVKTLTDTEYENLESDTQKRLAENEAKVRAGRAAYHKDNTKRKSPEQLKEEGRAAYLKNSSREEGYLGKSDVAIDVARIPMLGRNKAIAEMYQAGVNKDYQLPKLDEEKLQRSINTTLNSYKNGVERVEPLGYDEKMVQSSINNILNTTTNPEEIVEEYQITGKDKMKRAFLKGKEFLGKNQDQLVNAAMLASNLASNKRLQTRPQVAYAPNPIYNYRDLSGQQRSELASSYRTAAEGNRLSGGNKANAQAMFASKVKADSEITNQEAGRRMQYDNAYNTQRTNTGYINAGIFNQAENTRITNENAKIANSQAAVQNFVEGVNNIRQRDELASADKRKVMIEFLKVSDTKIIEELMQKTNSKSFEELVEFMLKEKK